MDREEKEIRKIRLRIVDLLKSFYQGEPDSEKISRWRGTFSALAKERVNEKFDRGVREILSYLENRTLEDLQQEYYKLFTDPFTDMGLSTSASYYLDGRIHGQTLIDIRSLLVEVGIAKQEGVVQTEDDLLILLDIYHRLIELSDEAGSKVNINVQEQLLQKYLLPFAEKFTEMSMSNRFAEFYSSCAVFFCGYLEMEKGLRGAVVSS